MAELTFELDTRKIEKKLDILAKSISDFSPVFSSSGDDLVEYFSNDVVFAQGQKSGGRWKDWSPTTLKLRANRSGYYRAPPERTDMILVWTGRLRRGFKKIATKTYLRVYNIVEYFKYHQAGGRPILDINAEVVGMVMRRAENYIRRILR